MIIAGNNETELKKVDQIRYFYYIIFICVYAIFLQIYRNDLSDLKYEHVFYVYA